jgi:hypothetical protein
MGLDTTHDCWSGPYSSFMRWRCRIHQVLRNYVSGDVREDYMRAVEDGCYADQSDPINFLMMHSDCDGEIPADMCGPMADALEERVLKQLPERALYDDIRPATERFIAGLRDAASRGEAVLFL